MNAIIIIIISKPLQYNAFIVGFTTTNFRPTFILMDFSVDGYYSALIALFADLFIVDLYLSRGLEYTIPVKGTTVNNTCPGATVNSTCPGY